MNSDPHIDKFLASVGLASFQYQGKSLISIDDLELFADKMVCFGPMRNEHDIRRELLKAQIRTIRMERDAAHDSRDKLSSDLRKLRKELAAARKLTSETSQLPV